ncbi:MFS transporter [Roseibacterium beibuensis]|uniref:MFS transporter n=1 Tax=[Roseibacterium] beibuensis TaxID=1193142 RepID=UPI00217EC5D3|nr:MFS transporter [Roseibacterium beibuensis]MCS6622543.1 MFS transporter [Roseibacterium beibuensis]
MLILLAVAHLAAAVDRAIPSVVAPLIRAELALSDQAIGALQGPAFAALYAITLLIAADWMRRFDAHWLAAGAVLVWTAGGLLFALAPTYLGLVCGRVLLGMGQAAFIPAALLMIGHETSTARRARGLSMFTAGSAAGRSVALLIGGLILSILGPQIALGFTSWRITGIVMVLPNLIVAALLLQAGSWKHLRLRRGLGLSDALQAVAADPGRLISLALVCSGTVLVGQAAGAWAPSILHRNFGLDVHASAVAFGAVVLVFAPAGHILAGWLAGDRRWRIPLDRIMVWSLIAAGGCSAALALDVDVTVASTALIGLTLTSGVATGVGMILFQSQIDVPLRGSVSALLLILTSTLGVGAGPWITGLLSDALGRDEHLPWALSMTIAIVILAVALLVGIFGGRWRAFALPPSSVSGGGRE